MHKNIIYLEGNGASILAVQPYAWYVNEAQEWSSPAILGKLTCKVMSTRLISCRNW